jgi:phosphatidate cytidylyltransferase
MSSLQLRILSALVVICLLVALTYFFQANGIRIAIVFFTLASIREAGRMLFSKTNELNERLLMMLSAFIVFILSLFVDAHLEVIFSIVSTFAISVLILRYRHSEKINESFLSIMKMFVGIFYVGLLPAFTYLILNLENNLTWFFVLLMVVFAGDTLAYISGLLWGKEKIAPALSPKKTVVGALGGIVGAMLAGLMSVFLLPNVPWHVLILMSLVAGFIGQMGDFFESLVKRVAGVKDSGTLMPGHGGILDRIDGVLFAAPVVYFVAALFQ